MLRARFVMLNDFFKRYGHKLSPQNRKMLREYLNAYNKGRLSVCYTILKNRIFRKGLLQSLAMIYHILFFFKSIKAKSKV